VVDQALSAINVDDSADTADSADSDRDAALNQLFTSNYTMLVRLATLLGADDPENVVAEAFYQLYRRWRKLHDKSAAEFYVKSVVCNLTRMRIRHLLVARRHLQASAAQLPLQGETVGSAESLALLHDDQRQLVTSLHQLPSRQREALVLRYWMNLSENEMATVMKISGGSVKTHLARGMAGLSKTMEDRK
jgi:RNA polymerase sigma factor (sigma-70 family)